MRYYGKSPVEIVLKAEDQSPFLEKLKTYSDAFGAGNMSPERFVKGLYKNLSLNEQQKEIAWLEATKEQSDRMKEATMNSWNITRQDNGF